MLGTLRGNLLQGVSHRHRYSSQPLRLKYRLSSNPVKPDSVNSTQNRLSENALRL